MPLDIIVGRLYNPGYLRHEAQPISIDPQVPATPTGEPLIDVANPRHREVLEKLEVAYEAAASDEGFQNYLSVLAHLYAYSPRNLMLIYAQRPDATAVNAYDRWQASGRQVRKGERGIKIFYPQFRRVVRKNEETGEEEPRQVLTGFGIGNVFDIAQTDGPPVAQPVFPAPRFDTTAQAREIDRKVASFLIGEGLRVEKRAIPDARGFYSPVGKLVALADDLPDDDGKAKTLAHETSHYLADHHAAGWQGKALAEFVAEASAYAALLAHGVDTSDYSLPYLLRYTREPGMMQVAMPQIAMVTKKLIAVMDGERPEEIGEWL